MDCAKYGSAVEGDAASGFTITNTNKETVDVSGTKSWDDDSDRDGVRPVSITVNLMRDGAKADSRTVTPDASGMWAYAFAGLPKHDPADGHEYAYTVTEEAVPGYATSVNGTDIVNSYTPGKTSVTVTKAWADANNQDEKSKAPDGAAKTPKGKAGPSGKSMPKTGDGMAAPITVLLGVLVASSMILIVRRRMS